MRWLSGCFALALLAGGDARCGEASPVATHYTTHEGLPVDSTYDAAVDEDGFLWLATHDGLARFDGQQFSVFDMARESTIPDNRMTAFYRDAAGRTFARTGSGQLLRVRGDAVTGAVTENGDPLPRAAFVQDRPFCATLRDGQYCADGEGRFRRWLAFGANETVTAALAASGQRTWLISPHGGIWLQSPGHRRAVLRDEAFPDCCETATVDRDGGLWLVADRRLLHARQDGRVDWLTPADGVSADLVQLRQDPDGTMWVGSDRGVYRVVGDRLVRVVPAAGRRDGALAMSWRGADGTLWTADGGDLARNGRKVLSVDGLITRIYLDPRGGAWVATLRDGVYALTEPRVQAITREDGLPADNVYGVALAADGAIWMGSLRGGTQAIGPDGRIRQYGVDDGLPGPNTWGVAIAGDGDVYVAPYAPGLYRKRAGSERFARVALPPPLDSATVRAIDFDRRGDLWLGTSRGAWHRSAGAWHEVWPAPGQGTVMAILHAADGSTWFGGTGGLWRLQGAQADQVAPGRFGTAAIRGLFQDRDGAVWACTEGFGLLRVSGDGSRPGAVVRFGRAQGLPSNSPHAVRQDAAGNLWVNSNQGIFRITAGDLADVLQGRHAALSPLVLDRTDGLAEAEGNGGVQPASAIDAQGRILFPTQRGLVRIDPRKLVVSGEPPRPWIEEIDGDGHRLAISDGALAQGLRSVQIRYSAIDLHSGGRTRFRYRLWPDQRRWVEAGNQRTASFVALKPGRYRFEVIAGNSDGSWSTQPAALSFYMPPRWYEGRGFRALAAGGVLLLLGVLMRRRTGRLRAQAAALDRQVGERTGELAAEKHKLQTALTALERTHRRLEASHADIEQSHRQLAGQADRLAALDAFRARLLTDVSHELRTPLMLVNLSLDELAEGGIARPQQQRRLDQSRRQVQRLNGLVGQLIDLAQAEAGQVRLQIRRTDVQELLSSIVTAMAPMAERAGLALEVRHDAPPPALHLDRDRITTVLTNFLDNACRHAPRGSRVSVRTGAAASGDGLRVEVVDRGPGFPQEVAGRLFERFYRHDGGDLRGGLGVGLALSRELVELHRGRIGARSVAGQETCFWFELPLDGDPVPAEATDEAEAPAAEPASGEPPPPSRIPLVLMVEDHPDLADYLSERLGGFVPTVRVTDIAQARSWIGKARVGMLLIDVVLPDGDGIAFCRELRRAPAHARLPIVLMSAKAGQAVVEEATDAGADAFLAKPFSFEELLATVRRVWAPFEAIAMQQRERAPAKLAPLLELAVTSMHDAAFGVAQWASRVHLSERQLRRRIVDLTGLPPQVWLREQRLQRVHELVRSGVCRTLAEAGVRCGLENAAYLYRLYRERFGGASAAESPP